MSNIIGGEVPEHGTLKGQANILLGKDGASAYAIACLNGFVGTEEEWLESLTEQTRQNAAGVIAEADKAIAHIEEIAEHYSDIVQTTGDSETAVMSQKGTTNEINRIADFFCDAEYTVEVDLGLTIEAGYGINPDNGQNETLSASETDKYCCTRYRKFVQPVKISLLSDEYEFVVWCYSNYAHTAGTYTPTPNWVRTKSVLISNKENTTHFRICIRRVDGGALNTDLEKIKGLMTFHISRVVQEFGDNASAVMSQKSLTDAFTVTVSGNTVALDDAVNLPIQNLCVRGNTTKFGSGEPYAPISFTSVGEKGTVTITGNDDPTHRFTVNTGNGLHGNTLLADVIDATAGNIIKRFAEKVFDGTEDWKQYPGVVGVYYLDGITPEATALTAEYAEMAICTHFGQTAKDLTGAENALRFQKVTKSSRVYISCNQFVTVAELKAFLVNQHTNGTPVTMVYPRYSEEKIALTEAEIEEYRAFNSYHPYTKVSVDDGVLDVTYTINSVQHFERKNHKSTENYGITENYGKNCVRTIAHRGDVQTAPENTIAAYRQAIRNGYKYMETDVRFTGDGVPVMLHDATIDRTSNGKGSVSNFTLEELKQFDFGGWKSEEYAGEKIPTFAEMLAFCRATGMVPFIELKGQTKTQVETLVDLVDKYGLLNDVHWTSFSEQCLEYVRTAHADANLCYINSEVTAENAAMVAGWKTGKNEVGILPYRNATENAAKICRGAGLYMMAGTITNPSQVSVAPIYTSWFVADGVNATELLYRSAMGD